ncbi:RNA polymerase sigma70 [Paenibacillus swuensis]|uniref:RNA polymerase sigma70 n=1 Tax=Paenibacillus swuensis TaxID=1178515 RepID=A0A172TM35_9BACL|nr:sigma-70 family RNA polymerase sigma factor [Paenibacillus swuensis]ANE48101.1 RNA polymerase sigma70 [Paenibacillus swuensis]
MKSQTGPLPGSSSIDDIILYQQNHCQDVATRLLQHYESMVKLAAIKMSRNRNDLYEDLYQIGQIALLKLFTQYDTTLGIPFEPYAMKSLIGRMKNYLRDSSWYIQVPRRIKEKGVLLQQAIDELTMKLERSPDIAEIAAHLQLSVEETVEVLAGRECYQYVSLDTPLSMEEAASTIGDMISSDIDDYAFIENRLDLQQAFERLKEEERQILTLAYHNGYSQRMIAQEMGMSQMSVSRIQRRAMEKLKRILSELDSY